MQLKPVGLFIVFPNKLIDFFLTHQILFVTQSRTLSTVTQPSFNSNYKNKPFVIENFF